MFEKILVPLDGSKIAEQAFPFVVELATAFNSEVICAGVCEIEEKDQSQTCQLYQTTQADLLKGKIGPNAKVKSIVLEGKASEEILKYAKTNKVNLLVMTSHGKSGIRPWSLGSTMDKVLHTIDAPLLIIKANEKGEVNKTGLFNKILVPLDGSETGGAAIPYVTELNKKLKSEIILLQIAATGKHVHTIGGLNYINFRDLDLNASKTRAKEYLSRINSKLGESEISSKYEVKEGEADREIVKYAKDAKISLIALSSHGHTGLERWAYGSVTYKVLQTSDKSVLLVPFPKS
jgi:nucleotide-binding universal stress UspA family protein